MRVGKRSVEHAKWQEQVRLSQPQSRWQCARGRAFGVDAFEMLAEIFKKRWRMKGRRKGRQEGEQELAKRLLSMSDEERESEIKRIANGDELPQ